MKKLISNKNFKQKTIMSIIIVLLLSFAVPIQSRAGIGGILFDPLVDIVGMIGDAIVGAMQMCLVDGEFNNSDGDGGLLNGFMVAPDDFMAGKDTTYKKWRYSTSNSSGKKAEVTVKEEDLDSGSFWSSKYYIPVLGYTPEKIFSGLVPALDINFINPRNWNEMKSTGSYTTSTGVETNSGFEYVYENGDEMNKHSIARALHETIASWYVALRNLAIVGLMLVLVYVGIRIVISSTASDKSKYKQMLMDWLIALCLLFCLHYIMTFTTTIVTEVSSTIAGANAENYGNNIAVKVEGTSYEFNTDLMGLIRFKMQSPNGYDKLVYLIFYLAMVIYTCLFTFTYLKRVLVMAFLTLISPLVALTYPIDKLRDGKAQAFDMWFKEYIFNALVQPFHLIIYSIFVGSAIDLAVENPLFAIVALAFLTPAEKLLRKFFGFEKATTGGALGSFAGIAGGAAAFNMLKGALGHRHRGAQGGGGSKPPRTKVSGVEGDTPSLGRMGGMVKDDEFGNVEQVEGSGEDSRIRMNISDNTFTGNSSLIGGIGADGGIQGASAGGLGISTDNAMPGYGYNRGSGLFLPSEDIRGNRNDSGAEPPTPPEPPEAPTSQIRFAGSSFETSENDTRGTGAWLRDGAKGLAGAFGTWAGETAAGQKVKSAGKAVKGTARDMAGRATLRRAQAKRAVDKATQKVVPKPIRNTASTIGGKVGTGIKHVAKGAGNVALQTGKAAVVGAVKGTAGLAGAAVRSAPGAILGMAAGIAGDDLGDIWKYTAAGAALTNTALSGTGSRIGSFVSTVYQEGAYGDKEGAVAQRRKEYQKSEEVQTMYEQEYPDLSNKELKQKIKQGSYYDSIGIEGKDAIKAIKVEDTIKEEMLSKGYQEESAAERAQIIAANAMKEVKDYTAKDLRNEEKMKDLRKSLTAKCTKQGLNARDTKETVDLIVKGMKKARKVENDL